MQQPASIIQQQITEMTQALVERVPFVIAAIGFLVIAYIVGRLVRRGVVLLAVRRKRPDLGNLIGSVVFGGFMILAILFASAIVFPTVHPGDIVAALGAIATS